MTFYLANAFIVAYLLFAWGVSSPTPTVTRRKLGALIRYLRFLGLSQSWSMFAPDPLRASRRLLVEMRLRDGSSLVWASPEVHRMPPREKFLHVRTAKFFGELYRGTNRGLRRPFAEYLMAELGVDPGEVSKVELSCVASLVLPPGSPAVHTPPQRSLLLSFTPARSS
ncbi:hypothetical protein [Sorangium sp. So ce861]|uniref:hypothetical protein n=1 Tax=Sorangium sp. So ce861 TaxID=3133323 RepID=UPI003F60A7D9